MFDSVKNWLGRKSQHQAAADQLAREAKDFRIPSEFLPQLFKYIFFVGLGFLNYRLFSHAVPGLWGRATGVVAVMAEAIALYAAHNFSRSSGAFRISLGAAGSTLMLFSLVHGTFSILDLIGAADVAFVSYYSRVVAFPLLAGLVGLSVIAITMTHPRNVIRLKQAAAHTRIAIGRAEAASELELMRASSVLDQARLDQQRERTRREQEYLVDLEKLITVEERKAQLVAAISNPQLREAMACELGIDLQPVATTEHQASSGATTSNWTRQAAQQPAGNGSARPHSGAGVL